MHLIAAASPAVEAGGLTGFVLDAVRAIGEVGIAVFVLLETVVPPIPSEVVLPFAGALAADGRFTFAGVVTAASVGSVLGAWLLYEAARWAGEERVTRWLATVPLVEREDVDRGSDWFRRYGGTAVLVGRLAPGVRSLVSVPAGAQAMPRPRFLLLTAIGSTAWNVALVGAGLALGRRWTIVEEWTGWLDVAFVVALLVVVGRLAYRRVRTA